MLFEREKSKLLPLPANNIIEKYLESHQRVKVSNESLIRYKGKAFSVKPEYINCYVGIEEYNEKLYIYYQNDLIDVFALNQYNQKINYKPEHYSVALAMSIGKNVQQKDIEEKALENLNKLSMIGGIVNDLQQVNK